MVYIEISDLVGNAFASYLNETGKHILNIKKINEFGIAVVNTLMEQGIEACLLLSPERTNNFFSEYANYFTLVESDNLVVLHNSVTVDELLIRFSSCLDYSVLLAFIKKENTDILLPGRKVSIHRTDAISSFIERLTDDEIKSFLHKLYPVSSGYCCSFKVLNHTDTGKSYISVIAYNYSNRDIKNIRLEEFSSNISKPEIWLKHLSSIFGSDYSRAFLEYGSSLFEED